MSTPDPTARFDENVDRLRVSPGVAEMRRIWSGVACAVAAGYVLLQLLGRRAGSTQDERQQRLPGDELVRRPQIVTDHAVTFEVASVDIWPWLTQMGWHLGGYYTPTWVDRLLFPDSWSSLDHLDPVLVRDLHAGDVIPDGPSGTAWFVVEEADAPRSLVLHSTTHVPAGWRAKFGVSIDWTWCFQVIDLPGSRARVHLRVRGRMAPRWFAWIYQALIIPADYVMALGMLRGIAKRAETHAPPRRSGRIPYAPPTEVTM